MSARKYSEILTLGLVMVVVALLLTLFIGPQFLGVGNLQSMAFQLPELGILSLAMMITMLTGGINLSIIASANLTGIVTAMILIRYADPAGTGPGLWVIILLAMLAGLAISTAIGLLNGGLIAWAGVSPILATLGTMILLKGLAIVLTKGYVLSGLPAPVLFLGNGVIAGIPVPMILFALCALVMGVILNRTPMGVRIYMIGSNITACYFSGVNNAAVLLKTYLISGLYSGIAALIMIARFNSAKADYGESYLLLTVLASVLGGTSAAGGFGRVSGLVIALIILQLVASGLNLLRVSAFLTIAMWGAILILVMVANTLVTRYRERRALAY
ncbi:MAG: ABC transporter permease [Anaerolineae bacterium]|nr:ABC transporter permease [Anaerolineae bacterium]MDW8098488.1 ABC transporter permease [Anaerolineae bacterium]